MFEAIIALFLFSALSDGLEEIGAAVSIVISAALTLPALYFRNNFRALLKNMPDKFIWYFSSYTLATTFILQYWRELLKSLDMISVLFLVLLSVFLFILMFVALYQIRRKIDIDSTNKIMSTLEEAQRQSYRQLLGSIDSLKIANHDSRHHIRTIKGLLAEGQCAVAVEYIEQLEKEVAAQDIPQVCLHFAVDSLIKYYISVCRQNSIRLEYKINLPKTVGISDVDLCSALSNCLENAVKAVKKLDEDLREIEIVAEIVQTALIIKVKNNFLQKETFSKSSGIGHISINRIADKYNGSFNCTLSNGIFEACLVLQQNSD